MAGESTGFVLANDVWYSPTGAPGTWVRATDAAFTAGRKLFGLGVLNDAMFAVGGQLGEENYTNEVLICGARERKVP